MSFLCDFAYFVVFYRDESTSQLLAKKTRVVNRKHFQDGSIELQIPPLRSPGSPEEPDGVGAFYAPFFTEGRTRGLVSAAWQEIRVRSGRDDTSLG